MKRFRLADEIKSTALITGLRNINIMLLTAVEGKNLQRKRANYLTRAFSGSAGEFKFPT